MIRTITVGILLLCIASYCDAASRHKRSMGDAMNTVEQSIDKGVEGIMNTIFSNIQQVQKNVEQKEEDEIKDFGIDMKTLPDPFDQKLSRKKKVDGMDCTEYLDLKISGGIKSTNFYTKCP
ncbi:uncharacterized protein LOC141905000 [Tubulanus polymorphus]|uniref:uncharacterized protein LOC141905000 n=1 Tax=Tubulanus polymorphus TaxID=672921 RepID=UPI003DA56548